VEERGAVAVQLCAGQRGELEVEISEAHASTDADSPAGRVEFHQLRAVQLTGAQQRRSPQETQRVNAAEPASTLVGPTQQRPPRDDLHSGT
jgi:hypothetical protein